jgi:transposase
VNEHGLPLQLELSAGQVHDAPMAELLLRDLPEGTSIVADKGYDADWIRDMIEDQDCTPVIPPKIQQDRADPVLQAQIQEAKPRRTLHQQAQAVPPHRNSLPPPRLSLSGFRQNRRRATVAQVL